MIHKNLAWFCLTGCLWYLPDPVQADAAARPNIVVIMADDLGRGDLGCYGQKLIQTPNLDRLAAEGMKFTQAYAGSSVCTPSRCALMTGMHNGHAAARDNVPHYATYLRDSDVTLAAVLTSAGYRCGGVGKWSLGDAGTVGRATNQGFQTWFGYLNQDHAHYYFAEYLDDNDGRLVLSGNGKSREHYSHHLLTERAMRFMRQSRDQPFFLYAAYTLVHSSAAVEDATRLAIPSDAPYSDKPWDQKARNYAAMVTLLDTDVGRIVKLLDELGLREKTLVIFTSDNGPVRLTPDLFASSGGLRGEKRDLYEGGLRVPFIVRWPGTIPASQVNDDVIAFWDILPTLAEIAGTPAPAGIDGISVVEALKGRRIKTPHSFLYWDYGHCRRRYDQAVRLGDWKGIRLGKESPIQLYDLSADVEEKHDVARQHPSVVAQIAHIMETAV
ncbi:MAG: arylsulfatase, partial [Planctomycetaceae bacterium]